MSTSELAELVSELRWLVSELGNELETLETTAYPLAHRFLMNGLAQRIARVAEHTTQCLSPSLATPVARPEEQPVEYPA
jgi:hypothetical protein